jgi:hypothetical protein
MIIYTSSIMVKVEKMHHRIMHSTPAQGLSNTPFSLDAPGSVRKQPATDMVMCVPLPVRFHPNPAGRSCCIPTAEHCGRPPSPEPQGGGGAPCCREVQLGAAPRTRPVPPDGQVSSVCGTKCVLENTAKAWVPKLYSRCARRQCIW